MLRFILGPAGCGKTYYIRNEIANCVRGGDRNIALLVPEQNNFESERAMLKLLGSASTEVVEVISFTRLAEQVEQACGHCAADAADDGVKMLIMGRAVRQVKAELAVYSRSCESPEFCKAVLDLVEECKRSAITPTQLHQAAFEIEGALKSKTADLSLIIRTYEALLASRFRDPLDDLTRLTESLSTVEYFKGKKVFIDAFKGFTAQQFLVLDRIFAQAEDVYVTLCTDSLHDEDRGIGLFSNVKRTAERLMTMARDNGVAVASPIILDGDERFGGSVISNAERLLRGVELEDVNGGGITVCSCANRYDEADYVARTIRKLVRTEGYRYRDFAVVARDIEEYHAMLVNAFERYGLPCFSDRRVDIDSLALIRFVTNALNSAGSGFAFENIIPYVKSALSPLSVEQAAELENYVLLWNKRGTQWYEEWVENPNGLDTDFDEDGLKRINGMRADIVEPLKVLSKALDSGNVKNICGAVYRFLISVGADKRLAEYAAKLEGDGDTYFADLHRNSWDALMACLDKTVRVFEGENCDKAEFLQLFAMLLSSTDLGAIPDRLDEVVIGSADRIRLGGTRAVFMIGANYGEFPRPVKLGGLLSGNDRRRLIRGGLNMPDYARENAVDEQFIVYTSVTGASERLYLTYHTSSLKGESGTPSEFVVKICENILQVVRTTSQDSYEDCFEGALPAIELVSGESHKKYAQSLKDELDRQKSHRSALLDPILNEKKSVTLKPETAQRLFGSDIKMSASKAEVYSKCPFSFFCEFGVGAKPSKSAEFDALQNGTLVHYVLEHAVSSYGARLADVDPKQRQDEIMRLIREYADQSFGGYDRLDRAFLFLLERVAIVLDDILRRIGCDFAQSEFKPDKFELRIGSEELEAVKVNISNGSVLLRGAVDRVDVYKADGKTYVRVVDYKTGSKKFDVSDLFYGINMQMLLYLFAIVDSDLYENAECSGVLYLPSRREIKMSSHGGSQGDEAELGMNGLLINDEKVLSAMEPEGKGTYIPYYPHNPRKKSSLASKEDFARLKKQIYSILAQIGENIHAGRIEVDPIDSKNGSACSYCNYKSVCLHREDDNRKAESYSLSSALEKLAEEVE